MTPRERRYFWTRYYYANAPRTLWQRLRDYVTACWLALTPEAGE